MPFDMAALLDIISPTCAHSAIVIPTNGTAALKPICAGSPSPSCLASPTRTADDWKFSHLFRARGPITTQPRLKLGLKSYDLHRPNPVSWNLMGYFNQWTITRLLVAMSTLELYCFSIIIACVCLRAFENVMISLLKLY
jgi:hypothetical protein